MIPLRWSRQPQVNAKPDYSGLGAGIQMLLLPFRGSLLDVAAEIQWTQSGNAAANKPTHNGYAASFDGVDDYYAYTGYPWITGNIGTFFCWMPRCGVQDTNGWVVFGTNTTNNVYFQVFNAANDDAAVFAQTVTTVGVSNIYSSFNTSLVFSSDGSAAGKQFCINGTSVGTASGLTPTAFASGNKSFRFGAWVAANTFDCDMDCVVAGFTNRPWSAYEARAFHTNPWQLFAPLQPRIYVDVPAVGGGGIVSPLTRSHLLTNGPLVGGRLAA